MSSVREVNSKKVSISLIHQQLGSVYVISSVNCKTTDSLSNKSVNQAAIFSCQSCLSVVNANDLTYVFLSRPSITLKIVWLPMRNLSFLTTIKAK